MSAAAFLGSLKSLSARLPDVYNSIFLVLVAAGVFAVAGGIIAGLLKQFFGWEAQGGVQVLVLGLTAARDLVALLTGAFIFGILITLTRREVQSNSPGGLLIDEIECPVGSAQPASVNGIGGPLLVRSEASRLELRQYLLDDFLRFHHVMDVMTSMPPPTQTRPLHQQMHDILDKPSVGLKDRLAYIHPALDLSHLYGREEPKSPPPSTEQPSNSSALGAGESEEDAYLSAFEQAGGPDKYLSALDLEEAIDQLKVTADKATVDAPALPTTQWAVQLGKIFASQEQRHMRVRGTLQCIDRTHHARGMILELTPLSKSDKPRVIDVTSDRPDVNPIPLAAKIIALEYLREKVLDQLERGKQCAPRQLAAVDCFIGSMYMQYYKQWGGTFYECAQQSFQHALEQDNHWYMPYAYSAELDTIKGQRRQLQGLDGADWHHLAISKYEYALRLLVTMLEYAAELEAEPDIAMVLTGSKAALSGVTKALRDVAKALTGTNAAVFEGLTIERDSLQSAIPAPWSALKSATTALVKAKGVLEDVEPALEDVKPAVEQVKVALANVATAHTSVEQVEPALEGVKPVFEQATAALKTIGDVRVRLNNNMPVTPESAQVKDAFKKVEWALEDIESVFVWVAPALVNVMGALEGVQTALALAPVPAQVETVLRDVEDALEGVYNVLTSDQPSLAQTEAALDKVEAALEAVQPSPEQVERVLQEIKPALARVKTALEQVENAFWETKVALKGAHEAEAIRNTPALQDVAPVAPAIEPVASALKRVLNVLENVVPNQGPLELEAALGGVEAVLEGVEATLAGMEAVLEAVQPWPEHVEPALQDVDSALKRVRTRPEIAEAGENLRTLIHNGLMIKVALARAKVLTEDNTKFTEAYSEIRKLEELPHHQENLGRFPDARVLYHLACWYGVAHARAERVGICCATERDHFRDQAYRYLAYCLARNAGRFLRIEQQLESLPPLGRYHPHEMARTVKAADADLRAYEDQEYVEGWGWYYWKRSSSDPDLASLQRDIPVLQSKLKSRLRAQPIFLDPELRNQQGIPEAFAKAMDDVVSTCSPA